MYNSTMTDMCCFFQYNSNTWKHMNSAILLNITSILYNNFTPVTAYCSTRTDINIFAYNHVTGNHRLWMNKGCFMNYWDVTVERINHNLKLESSKLESLKFKKMPIK